MSKGLFKRRSKRQHDDFWWYEDYDDDPRPHSIFSNYLADIMNSDDPRDHHPRYETEPPVHTG